MRVTSDLFSKVNCLLDRHRFLLIYIKLVLSAFHPFRLMDVLMIIKKDPLF